MSQIGAIRCPGCGSSAPAHNLSGLIIEVCEQCGGVWFGSNQMRQVLSQGPETLDELMGFAKHDGPEPRRAGNLKCPGEVIDR